MGPLNCVYSMTNDIAFCIEASLPCCCARDWKAIVIRLLPKQLYPAHCAFRDERLDEGQERGIRSTVARNAGDASTTYSSIER